VQAKYLAAGLKAVKAAGQLYEYQEAQLVIMAFSALRRLQASETVV
jgi:hypothetical protein